MFFLILIYSRKELFYPIFICLNEFLGPKNGKNRHLVPYSVAKNKNITKITKHDQCLPTQTPLSGEKFFLLYLENNTRYFEKHFFLISKFPKHFSISVSQTNLRTVVTKSQKIS